VITEESFVDFKCPHCGEPVSFPQQDAGSARACPDCMETLVVPAQTSEVGLKLPLPVTTPRLALRRLNGSDWQDLLEFMSDEELFHYVEGWPLEEEQVLHWLEADSRVQLTTPGQLFCLGIELQEVGKLVGFAGLSFSSSHPRQATVGSLFLNRNFQRKGLAQEGLKALLGFCFGGINCHRVSASCDSRNTAGCRLFERVGFRREGEFVKDRFVKGEWVNTVCYATLVEEYAKAESGSRGEVPAGEPSAP
jgi:[ribosomal protein S5]-alanine N-acetyltransferase